MFAAWLVLPLASSVQKASALRRARQAADEAGDVGALDAAAVLRADLHGVRARRDALAPVAGHVRVDAALERAEQRRLAVVAAADDQRHAFGNAEAGDAARRAAARGKRELDAQRVRRAQRVRAGGERPIARAALAREDRAVRDEGDEAARAELAAQVLLVLDAADEVGGGAGRKRARAERRAREGAQVVAQEARGLPAEHPAALGGQPIESRASTCSGRTDTAVRCRTSCAPASTTIIPLLPSPLPRLRLAISRASARARKSSSAARRTGPSKSSGGKPASLSGTRSRTREGGAKGSPWMWSTASSSAPSRKTPVRSR